MNNIIIDILDFGKIEVELYPNIAPKTVENFLNIVDNNLYENTTFHRIIKGFMIQGGATNYNLQPIYGEFNSNGFENNLKHTKGVISMARTMDPNSATSQFFIMHEDSPHLDGEYAAFGKVVSGLDIVDRIANEKTDMFDSPLNEVIIKKIYRK